MTHPLTDEMMEAIHGNRPGYSNPFDEDDMRAAADWQLEQVIEWLNIGYQTDPNLSREVKQRGGFKAIAIALEKAMRPQEDNQ